ncbi:hypothetical protein JCGZ_19127 [Jatropha curcas]|uniref:Uncharacterized protein n=1 Tax=Jatropha curcas TaxID=180498 RepID=A0A067KBG7_JATCU|nr:hypothetical protein JCGZ_19127 [Jatropha curcas]
MRVDVQDHSVDALFWDIPSVPNASEPVAFADLGIVEGASVLLSWAIGCAPIVK